MNEIKHKFMRVEQELKRQEKLLKEPKISIKSVLLTAIELLFCAAALTFAFFGIMAPEYITPILEYFK
jgi:hypothetical protein